MRITVVTVFSRQDELTFQTLYYGYRCTLTVDPQDEVRRGILCKVIKLLVVPVFVHVRVCDCVIQYTCTCDYVFDCVCVFVPMCMLCMFIPLNTCMWMCTS